MATTNLNQEPVESGKWYNLGGEKGLPSGEWEMVWIVSTCPVHHIPTVEICPNVFYCDECEDVWSFVKRL